MRTYALFGFAERMDHVLAQNVISLFPNNSLIQKLESGYSYLARGMNDERDHQT